jgi:hypothetical protein
MCRKPQSPASDPSKSSRTVSVKMPTVLLITLKLKNAEKTKDINLFYTQKVLSVITRKVTNSS